MYKEVIEKIMNANNIYLTGHINPDGDSIGSCFAMYLALRDLGKNAKVIMPEVANQFNYFEELADKIDKPDVESMELYICLDCADINRTVIDNEHVHNAKNTILIDHHKTNSGFATVNVIEPNATSTSEIVYKILKEMNVEMTKDIAKFLYIGIIMDTRSLTTSLTTAKTFEIVSDLVSTGIDFQEIYKNIINTMKYGKLKLLAKTIDNMEMYLDNRVVYSIVENDEISKFELSDEDSEGMTNYGQMIDGVEVSVYVRGKSNGTYKVSMRSNGNVDIAIIAASFECGGGGHARAAGYVIEKEKLNSNKEELILKIKEQLDRV